LQRSSLFDLAIVGYGLLNAILYASLVPLWEGFDEPFHYGYVQSLSNRGRLPALGRTPLSAEIWRSMELAPVSPSVQRNLPALRSFDEYRALAAGEQSRLRRALDTIDPRTRNQDSAQLNYEAPQAPLAYILLAAPDAALSHLPLALRVLWLRFLCGTIAVLLTAGAAVTLARLANLGAGPRSAVLFILCSSQMFYAATAHVSNDWLSIPLAAWVIVALAVFIERASRRAAVILALVLAAGLLTKAYFLAFVPACFGVVAWQAWRRRARAADAALFAGIVFGLAGPWYTRNLVLYGVLSGTQEAASGIGPAAVAGALLRMPWARTLWRMATDALWTGNNHFTTFARNTMACIVILLLAALALYLRRLFRRRAGPAEIATLVAGACYSAALLYAAGTAAVVSRWESTTAASWHMQPLLVPVLLLAALGCSPLTTLPLQPGGPAPPEPLRPHAKRGRAGRIVLTILVTMYAYLITATYFAKLIPLYGGYGPRQARFAELTTWYRSVGPSFGLNLVALAPGAIGTLLLLVLVLAPTLSLIIDTRLRGSRELSQTPRCL
jgi:hypothetical protein